MLCVLFINIKQNETWLTVAPNIGAIIHAASHVGILEYLQSCACCNLMHTICFNVFAVREAQFIMEPVQEEDGYLSLMLPGGVHGKFERCVGPALCDGLIFQKVFSHLDDPWESNTEEMAPFRPVFDALHDFVVQRAVFHRLRAVRRRVRTEAQRHLSLYVLNRYGIFEPGICMIILKRAEMW